MQKNNSWTTIKRAAGIAVIAAFVFASYCVFVSGGFNPVTYAQSASYPLMQIVTGATVNGKPTIFPATQVLDTQTTVAAGTLNGTNSPTYDVTIINERARMVNISFNVTAVPGTSPSLTPTVQESDDGGVTFYVVNAQDGSTFAAITSTGSVTGKDFPIYGDVLRVHYAASGTGNFTFTDTAKQAQ